MHIETLRVTDALFALLDDPSSLPERQPHCGRCGTPKPEWDRNRRCELCREYGTVTGAPRITGNVFIERVTIKEEESERPKKRSSDRPKRKIRIVRRANSGSLAHVAAQAAQLSLSRKNVGS